MVGRSATSARTGAGEPVEVYGAGPSGAFGLLLRARGVCVPAEDLPYGTRPGHPGRAGRSRWVEELTGLEVLYDRVAAWTSVRRR